MFEIIDGPAPQTSALDKSALELPLIEVDLEAEQERLSDPNDIASRSELFHNAESVMRARLAVAPEVRSDPKETGCEDCGRELPNARIEMGRIRCVECQEIKEKLEKRYCH